MVPRVRVICNQPFEGVPITRLAELDDPDERVRTLWVHRECLERVRHPDFPLDDVLAERVWEDD